MDFVICGLYMCVNKILNMCCFHSASSAITGLGVNRLKCIHLIRFSVFSFHLIVVSVWGEKWLKTCIMVLTSERLTMTLQTLTKCPPPLQFHYDLGTVLAVMAALGYLSMWLTELEIFFTCNCVHYNNVAVWSFIIRTLYQILLGWSIQWGLYSQGMQHTQGDEECTLNFSWKPWKERITKEV
jgi:hypothetical protein